MTDVSLVHHCFVARRWIATCLCLVFRLRPDASDAMTEAVLGIDGPACFLSNVAAPEMNSSERWLSRVLAGSGCPLVDGLRHVASVAKVTELMPPEVATLGDRRRRCAFLRTRFYWRTSLRLPLVRTYVILLHYACFLRWLWQRMLLLPFFYRVRAKRSMASWLPQCSFVSMELLKITSLSPGLPCTFFYDIPLADGTLWQT